MKQMEQIIQKSNSSIKSNTVNSLSVSRLNHFQIPRRELIPEQLINSHKCFTQTIFTEQIGNLSSYFILFGLKPADSQLRRFGNFSIISNLPSFDQPESIPYLVTEITSLLAQCIIKENVVPGRSRKHHTHTYPIGTVFFN